MVRSLEVVKSNLATLRHGFLTFAHPDTWVVLLLVGLVGALRVADLAHKVILLGKNKVTDTLKVGILRVGVDVHLDNTVIHSRGDFVLL